MVKSRGVTAWPDFIWLLKVSVILSDQDSGVVHVLYNNTKKGILFYPNKFKSLPFREAQHHENTFQVSLSDSIVEESLAMVVNNTATVGGKGRFTITVNGVQKTIHLSYLGFHQV